MIPKEIAIGQLLKKARQQRKLTIAEISQRMRTSKNYLREIEAGKHEPSLVWITRAVNALGYSLRLRLIDPITGDDVNENHERQRRADLTRQLQQCVDELKKL